MGNLCDGSRRLGPGPSKRGKRLPLKRPSRLRGGGGQEFSWAGEGNAKLGPRKLLGGNCTRNRNGKTMGQNRDPPLEGKDQCDLKGGYKEMWGSAKVSYPKKKMTTALQIKSANAGCCGEGGPRKRVKIGVI